MKNKNIIKKVFIDSDERVIKIIKNSNENKEEITIPLGYEIVKDKI